ncbi:hypothetical protein L210DRAFT_838282, partial [Boletus edulis BED1]
MPHMSGYRYIVQARCAQLSVFYSVLTAYPEWHVLRSENAHALTSFIFKDILCCWGAISEIVTDNG